MKKIIVTGANGFIGRHCIPLLQKKNYNIYATTSGKRNHLPVDSDITWCQTDLLSKKEITDLLEQIKPTHLLHFSWYTEHGKFWHSNINLEWISSTLHLLREFQRNGGQRFVGAGSCAEYDWNYGYCIEDLTPLQPNSLYGISKKSVYSIGKEFAKLNKISFAWGRIFFAFGPYEKTERLIAYVISSLIKNELATCSPGQHYRDFMYVKDIADAFVELLDSEIEDAINIASGKPRLLKDIINLIGENLNKTNLIQFSDSISDEVPLLVGNTQRLENELNWRPDHTFEEAVQKTVKWWLKEIKPC